MAVAVLSLCWGLESQAATTFYVSTNGNDSNDGSLGSPWLTVQHAANTVAAGDSVIVSNGVFAEVVATKTAGTAANPITFTGSGQTVLQAIGVYHQWNYVDNFTFTTSSTPVYAALSYTASNIRLTRNIVSNMNHSAFRMIDSGGGSPAVSDWPTNVYIAGNHVQGIVGVGAAVVFIGSSSVIESNTIEACMTDAIDLWGAGNVVRRNAVTNILRDTYSSPENENHNDFIQSWGITGWYATNNLVEANLVINSYLQLYNLEDVNFTNTFNRWTFRNNVFVNDLRNGNVGIPYCVFENNTYYHAPYDSGAYTPIICLNQDGAHGWGTVITNNIFVNCGYSNGVDGLKVGYYGGAAGATPTADYNYVAGLQVFGYPTVSGFSEANGVNGGNPLFVDIANGNAGLQVGSPAIHAGVNLSSSFTTDFSGVTRTAPWDIGAYEYVPLGPTTLNVSGSARVGTLRSAQ